MSSLIFLNGQEGIFEPHSSFLEVCSIARDDRQIVYEGYSAICLSSSCQAWNSQTAPNLSCIGIEGQNILGISIDNACQPRFKPLRLISFAAKTNEFDSAAQFAYRI